MQNKDRIPQIPMRTPGPRPADPRLELLHRVAGSSTFERSNRLRELLLFLGERALAESETPIREQDIGVELFGRPPGYETSQDTLVRVQASQLRKKLQKYFEDEGRGEPLVIELPKGSYVPVFRSRVSIAAEAASPAPSGGFLRVWLPWLLAGVFALVTVSLVVRNAALEEQAAAGRQFAPTVNRFWRQALGNGRQSHLVLSDALLVLFEDAIGRHLTVQEYRERAFSQVAAERIPDPARRSTMLDIVGRMFTGRSDAAVASKVGLVCGLNNIPLDVVLAREINASETALDNLVLVGSLRANPWVGLYEEKLNFRSGFEESPMAAFFANSRPQPGERNEYRGAFGILTYCRVAFLPNAKGTGNVVLVNGTDVAASDAGGEFLTNETWLRYLRDALGLADAEPFPYFEVLLRGKILTNTVPKFDIVAFRRH